MVERRPARSQKRGDCVICTCLRMKAQANVAFPVQQYLNKPLGCKSSVSYMIQSQVNARAARGMGLAVATRERDVLGVFRQTCFPSTARRLG